MRFKIIECCNQKIANPNHPMWFRHPCLPFLSSWHLPKKSLICATYFVSKEMDSGPHKTPSRPELDLARYFSIKVSKIYSTRSTRNLFFLYNLNGVIFFCRNMIEEYILIIAQDFVRKLLRFFFRENNDGKTYLRCIKSARILHISLKKGNIKIVLFLSAEVFFK